jgi:hypothetical protein
MTVPTLPCCFVVEMYWTSGFSHRNACLTVTRPCTIVLWSHRSSDELKEDNKELEKAAEGLQRLHAETGQQLEALTADLHSMVGQLVFEQFANAASSFILLHACLSVCMYHQHFISCMLT